MTSLNQPDLDAYWSAFVSSLPEGLESAPTTYHAWGFGDRPETADALGALVLKGIKTATASLVWAYEAEAESIPEVGDFSMILDGQGNPLCIIQTSMVTIYPFKDVDAEQAYLEGEGDRTLDFWRDVHWKFFSRECAELGREPSEEMPVVCERFNLVYP